MKKYYGFIVALLAIVGVLAAAACCKLPANLQQQLNSLGNGTKTLLDENGTLSSSDETLSGGEYIDNYDVQVREGTKIKVEMTSTEIDPYLIVKDPSGDQQDNDDCSDDTRDSCVEITITQSGKLKVGATTYEGGETGSYHLTVTQLAD